MILKLASFLRSRYFLENKQTRRNSLEGREKLAMVIDKTVKTHNKVSAAMALYFYGVHMSVIQISVVNQFPCS